MNVKQAVSNAKMYVADLFADEDLRNLGLEEVELDSQTNEWIVTIGFSRPWDEPKNTLAALASGSAARRAFKVVRISNASTDVVSVKNRE